LRLERRAGKGWLALIGGGEFSFGETEEIDQAWLAKIPSDGVVGFVPAASGSDDYGRHFKTYMDEAFGRKVEIIPLYRDRDGKRGKNAERILAADAIYLGGGVSDHLLDAIAGTPCHEALIQKLEQGGTVVGIAASAQALGQVVRSLFGGKIIEALGFLPGGAVETNFEPNHDRRLRQMMGQAAVSWGLGIPAESALFIGPQGETEIFGTIFALDHPDGDFAVLRSDKT